MKWNKRLAQCRSITTEKSLSSGVGGGAVEQICTTETSVQKQKEVEIGVRTIDPTAMEPEVDYEPAKRIDERAIYRVERLVAEQQNRWMIDFGWDVRRFQGCLLYTSPSPRDS